jgi:hypothetical protein
MRRTSALRPFRLFLPHGVQRKPCPHAGHGTEGLRVQLGSGGFPVNGGAAGQTVDAQALVDLGLGVRQIVPEPGNIGVVAFLYFDKAIYASRGLKFLEFFHGTFSLCHFLSRNPELKGRDSREQLSSRVLSSVRHSVASRSGDLSCNGRHPGSWKQPLHPERAAAR